MHVDIHITAPHVRLLVALRLRHRMSRYISPEQGRTEIAEKIEISFVEAKWIWLEFGKFLSCAEL